MRLTKKRWIILAACCLINLCLGSVYAWSVFASSLSSYFSALQGREITSGDLAIVYTVANAVGPVTMIAGGWFNDHIGPKKVILTGGVMCGMGMFLSGFMTNTAGLIVTYGLIYGLGLGMAYGSTVSTCVKFFPDKKGLIGGITTATYGFSSVMLPPVITFLVNTMDVRMAFRIIGIIFLILICGGSFFMDHCPDHFVPDEWTPSVPEELSAGRNEKNWRQMLASPAFYVMILLLTCGAFSGMMVISQASAIASDMIGMTTAAAGIVVSILALFNAVGRIAAGLLSDKIGRINTLTLACILSIFGLMGLYLSSEGTLCVFLVGISAVGICFGAFMGVFPGFTADRFGVRNNSVNYGIMFIGFAAAGYFGPMIMHHVYAADGAYQKAFLIACGLNAAGAGLTVLCRRIH